MHQWESPNQQIGIAWSISFNTCTKFGCAVFGFGYRQISNIRRTKSHNIYVSRLIFQLSLLKPLKPGVKSIMKM